MSTKIREIYYYAVCFVTLIITIFALTALINSITQIVYPYPQYTPSKLEIYRMSENPSSQFENTEKLQAWIEEEQTTQITREKAMRQHQLARELSRNLTLLIISVPLYLYHWRRVRKFEA